MHPSCATASGLCREDDKGDFLPSSVPNYGGFRELFGQFPPQPASSQTRATGRWGLVVVVAGARCITLRGPW